MRWFTFLPLLTAAVVRAQCTNTIIAGPPATADAGWLSQPQGIALDSSGNLYIADTGNNRIRKVTTDGVIHTVAGPDGLNAPTMVLAAPDGSVYVADTGNNRIERISAAGVLTVIAGTGHPGFSGDNGAAIAAELNGPSGMALDSKGRLYVADTNNARVRRIDTNGVITTVAGSAGYPFDAAGTSTTSSTSILVGTSSGVAQFRIYSGGTADGGPALTAALSMPQALAVASDGSLFILDTGDRAVRRVSPDGTISTIVSQIAVSDMSLLPDGSLLLAADDLLRVSTDGTRVDYYARANGASHAVAGPSGFYFTNSEQVVYHASSVGAEPTVYAGQRYGGNGAMALPGALAVGSDGSVWVADVGNANIRRIQTDGTQKVIGTLAGVSYLALDPAGNLFAGATESVWRFTVDGKPQLFAGGGYLEVPPVGAAAIPALSVALAGLTGLVADSAGNIFVSMTMYGYTQQVLIARISAAGQLTTIFDNTTLPGAATNYDFTGNRGLAIDAQGYLILSAEGNIYRIRPDGSGIADTFTVRDSVTAVAAAPSGEIYYLTTTGRIKSLHAGATLYNRDSYNVQFSSGGIGLGIAVAGRLSGLLTGYPMFSVTAYVVGDPALAADSLGNLYFSNPGEGTIRRFASGPCFTAVAPQLFYNSASPAPITPQTNSPYYWGDPTFAPGELITLAGTGLGPKTGVHSAVGSDGRIGTLVAGTRVLFNGVPAPVLFASDNRVDTVIPFSLYGYQSLLVQVEYNGVLSDAAPLSMNDSAPMLFTSTDLAGNVTPIVVNQDGSLNSINKPASAGSIVTLYGSGFGRTSPEGIDGHVAASPLPKPALPVSAAIGGQRAEVVFVGDAAGMVEGAVQMNVRVPQQDPWYGTMTVVVGNGGMEFPIYWK